MYKRIALDYSLFVSVRARLYIVNARRWRQVTLLMSELLYITDSFKNIGSFRNEMSLLHVAQRRVTVDFTQVHLKLLSLAEQQYRLLNIDSLFVE